MVGRLSTKLSSNDWVSEFDPMQVLEDQEQRLDLTLPKEQPPDRIERPLAALGRIKRFPPGIVDRHVQGRAVRGSDGSSARSSDQEFARHLIANLAMVVIAPRF